VTDADWTRIRHITDSLRAKHAARSDSIYNGADDDGSGTTTVLEIAEAFANARAKPKRWLLFVWDTGEELGLLGSSYFTDHPTVPRDSIVAQLNIDMVGRGGLNDITGVTKAGELIHGGPYE
jgi:Zn-dependent M28 family amino/carboxypeptidase